MNRQQDEFFGTVGIIGIVFIGAMVLGIVASIFEAFTAPAHAAPVTVTTINRADYMPAESPTIEEPRTSLLDNVTDWWDNMPMKKQARYVNAAGLFIEGFGKTLPSGFCQSLLRQFGVQMQVQALHHLDMISGDPGIAFVQGVLIGL
jgi:hypothetical protein